MATALGRWREVGRTLSRSERRRLGALAAVVVALHLVGFGVLLLAVAPRYSGVIGIGVGLTAWGFGLRHAFDADHISAIDNTTRKLMADGRRPLAVGFFFSLGHSTVVFALSFVLAFAARSVSAQITNGDSSLHSAGGYVGTGMSAVFLYAIAAINLVILLGIARIFRDMRSGHYDEETLEKRLNERGLINRLLGPLARSIKRSWQMYPIGVLFGLGFDTATEVGLLAIAASAGGADLPWYAILCLPVIFAAGMSMMDTADGAFMSLAYGWAFSNPVRKVFYNLTITALSVGVALLVGTVELLSVVATSTGHRAGSGGAWGFLATVDLNTVGFVIVGMFVVTWVGAVSLWSFGGIEERWRRSTAEAGGERPGPPSDRARRPWILVAAQTWLPVHACLLVMGALDLAINGGLVAASITDPARAALVALTLCTAAAVGAALVAAARAIDGGPRMAWWALAVALEAMLLAVGIATAHDYDGVVPAGLVGLPAIGLLLLLSPAAVTHLRSVALRYRTSS